MTPVMLANTRLGRDGYEGNCAQGRLATEKRSIKTERQRATALAGRNGFLVHLYHGCPLYYCPGRWLRARHFVPEIAMSSTTVDAPVSISHVCVLAGPLV